MNALSTGAPLLTVRSDGNTSLFAPGVGMGESDSVLIWGDWYSVLRLGTPGASRGAWGIILGEKSGSSESGGRGELCPSWYLNEPPAGETPSGIIILSRVPSCVPGVVPRVPG